ncbi:type II toxin-antitoxin system VapC family toxin [soil metagenome]
MKYLLDTCIVSYFARGEQKVLQHIKNTAPTDICISSITSMEIEFGLQLNPDRAKKLHGVLNAFLKSINILPFELADAHAAATLRALLQKQGSPIGPYDVLLAGCALNRSLIFVTANNHEFQRVDNLCLEDWR